MSCAKMTVLTEIQFGMLIWVGPGDMYYMGLKMPAPEGALLGSLAD